MDQIKYHIPWFIGGILFGIMVIAAFIYLSGLGYKLDKIYSILDTNTSCTND